MNCPDCKKEVSPEGTHCEHCGHNLAIELISGTLLSEKYRIDRLIAFGGMGAVYKGHDITLDRPIAIKALQRKFNLDNDLIRRFHREARATASLDHPNIIPVHAVGTENDIHYFVMKYVQGTTFGDLISDKLELESCLRILIQVLSGLEHIHTNGFVHRDIKPNNIMVNESGHAIILDFGVIRDLSNATLTQTGFACGTPLYISPEQARAMKEVDHRSDIYSTGIILYEILAGRPPFKGELMDVLFKHMKEMPTAPHIVDPTTPGLFSDIVMKAIAKEPNDRFQSAQEMRQAIVDAYEGDKSKLFDFVSSTRARAKDTKVDTPKKISTAPMFGGSLGSPSGSTAHDIAIGDTEVSDIRPKDDTQEGDKTTDDVRDSTLSVSTGMLIDQTLKSGSKWRKWVVVSISLIALIIGVIIIVSNKTQQDRNRTLLAGVSKKSGKLRRVTVSSAVPVKKATLTEKGRKRSSASTPLKRKLLENIRTIKPAPRATPPKPFVAWLTITSKQKGIWVRVDKNKPQRTPIRNIKIRSPKVRLRAWKRGYRSKTKVIKLSRGERKHLPITLRRLKLKPCTLNVVVLDAKGVVPANVHIGGKTFQAPFGNKKFRAGVYKIRVAWPGYMEYQGRITCRSGKPIRQTVRIRKK